MVVSDIHNKTELGAIPEDWVFTTWDNVFTGFTSGATPYRAIPSYYEGSIKWVSSGELNYNTIQDTVEHISELAKERTSLTIHPAGTFLMAITGLEAEGTRGSCALLDTPATTNQSCMAIYATSTLSASYLFRFYQFWGKSFALRYCQGTKQQSYTAKLVKKLPIVYPATEQEQTAIAEALSDADSLIASLEKLIEKKKAIKQGTMQELLTGKKRLPGFSGEWLESPLCDLFTFSGGLSASREQLSITGFPYLHYGDIHGSTKTYIDVSMDNIPRIDIDIKKVSPTTLLNNGDVVFVDASEDDEGASKHIVIRNTNSIVFISGLHTIVAKSKTDVIKNAYREFCFTPKYIKIQFKYYAAGTKVTGISKQNIAKIYLCYPEDTTEQTAIASILSDMDTEIEQLEKKLTKYQLIKQGMMQELLTGRIRLVESAVSLNVAPEMKNTVKGHSAKYDDAIAISAIVNAFYDDNYILGRVKIQKLLYLLRRKQEADVSGYKKKAAGPYNEQIRYNGGESIAIKKGYIIHEEGRIGAKFGKGANISIALKYCGKMQLDIDWLYGKFKFYNTADNKETNNLEVLATVDMAACELEQAGKPISLDSLKEIIRTNNEWAPKLKKACFADSSIQKAIDERNVLFEQKII